MNMKKVFASALIALFAFVACNGEDLPPVDNGDQNQTETPGGEDPGEEPGEDPGENPGEDPGKRAGKNPGTEAGKKPVASREDDCGRIQKARLYIRRG